MLTEDETSSRVPVCKNTLMVYNKAENYKMPKLQFFRKNGISGLVTKTSSLDIRNNIPPVEPCVISGNCFIVIYFFIGRKRINIVHLYRSTVYRQMY